MAENDERTVQDMDTLSDQVSQQDAGQESAVDNEIVRQLRREAASYRKKLRETEAQLQQTLTQVETERLTWQERLAEMERQTAELQRQYAEVTLRSQVQQQAAALGIVDPDAAWRLLDLAAVERDEQGNPSNVETLLRQLVQQRPWLLSGAGQALGATNPGRSSGTTVYRRSQLRDPKFFAEHRDDILAAMREGRIEED